VISKLGSYGILVGTIYTVEEITQMIPSYPDGRKARPRTVARRLATCLSLVERGPNGSKSRGARYLVLQEPRRPSMQEGDEPVRVDEDWLNDAVDKMTRTK
jgi:hypothetical protein